MLTVNSIFSGAGGFDLGFQQAGFKIISSCDFDKNCCKTLEYNFDHKVIHDDINRVTLDYADVLIGGSPCQELSNSNRNNNSNLLDSPKNALVLSYITKVQQTNPKVFVYENVPQVITAANGQFLREFRERLQDYHIEAKVLNSVNYGVAQTRKRAILIGSRIGIIKHPEGNDQRLTVRDAWDGLREDTPEYSRSSEATVERMKYVTQGGNWRDIPVDLRTKGTHSSYFRRLAYDEPSVTITNFRKAMLLHPEENRIISVREAARIQGFPDDFTFVGTLASKQQMVANAVAVPLARAIGVSIISQNITS